jgi:hypothetical protein
MEDVIKKKKYGRLKGKNEQLQMGPLSNLLYQLQ